VIAAAATRRLEVVGASMRPTLEPGDRLLAVRVRPRRVVAGDLVVVPDPRHLRRLVVKRVVAVSATTVTVAGDNPETSTDSRTFGPVPLASVRGRVVYRYHPPDRRNPIGRLVP
jgi:inner membrane protease subunit 1